MERLATGHENSRQWVACLDFGTATTKAALVHVGGRPQDAMPLAIGAASNSPSAYLSPSQIWIDRSHVLFAGHAQTHARQTKAAGQRAATSFKMLLAGNVLEHHAPRSIDTTGMFTNGDLICLYLAHIFAAMRRAASQLPGAIDFETAALRYSQPEWIETNPWASDAAISAIYDQAAAIADELDDQLLAPAGISTRLAVDTLARYRALKTPTRVEGYIYEAIAAANSYARPDIRNILAIDMGAGTTDIAGFSLFNEDGRYHATEVSGTRRMLGAAGDTLDDIVANRFLDQLKSSTHDQELWEALSPTVSSLKEEIFRKGSASFTFRKKTITVKRAALEGMGEYKEMTRFIAKEFGAALGAMDKYRADRGGGEIALVAAGGGSRMPFLKKLIESAAPSNRHIRYSRMIGDPAWAVETSAAYAGALPQLLTAIGGAVALDIHVTKRRAPLLGDSILRVDNASKSASLAGEP